MDVLITLGQSKKILSLRDKAEFWPTVERKFNIERRNYVLQYYNPEWDEYVDVDEDDIPPKSKLKLIPNAPQESPGDQVNPQDVPASDQVNPTDVPASDPEKTSANVDPMPTPSTSSIKCSTDTRCSLPGPSLNTKSTSVDLLRYKVTLHLVPRNLQEKLSKNLPINSKERGALLQAVYEDVTTNFGKFYLTHGEYDALSSSLLQQYPHLNDGLPSSDAKQLWHRRLKDKFKNSRKRSDATVEQVKSNKKLKKEISSENKNVWGVANFLPESPVAEDDASVKVHTEWMVSQRYVDKSKRDKVKIKDRMDRTFADRRKLIVKDFKPIKEIKEEYPLLFEEHAIREEIFRLTNSNWASVFETNLNLLAEKISRLPPSKKEPEIVKEVRGKLASSKLDSDKKYLTDCVALMCLPSHLKENLDDVLVKADAAEATHTGICWSGTSIASDDCSFTIRVENMDICETRTVTNAFLLLVSTYYVFNLAYPKKIVGTMTFLQKDILKVQDLEKKCVKVIGLRAKLLKM